MTPEERRELASYFHRRAAESADRLRQIVVTLSTATIAFLVSILVASDQAKDLNCVQCTILCAALILTAMSLVCGLLFLQFDSSWAYFRAVALKSEESGQGRAGDKLQNEPWGSAKDYANKRRLAHWAMLAAFVLGIILAGAFVLTLAFGNGDEAPVTQCWAAVRCLFR